LKAGERAALGPDPVLTTWCAHPASATPAKHCRPNVSPFLPHALHKVVSPIVRDERYLVNKMLRLQLSRARMRHENQDRWWNSAAPPVKEE
jgi:hypothetical protein